MPRNPVFSVILPVFNGEKFLAGAIQSVMNQTFINWELIIIDDGSADHSIEIAAAFAAGDERIRLLQHPGGKNRGVSASRNLGVQQAKGEWIALLDADDVWLPQKLEKQFKIVQTNKDLSLIYSKAETVFENYSGNVKNTLYGSGRPGLTKDPFIQHLNGFQIPTSSVVFNKNAFFKTGGFDEKMAFAEDTLLYHKLLLFGGLYFMDEPLVKARYHEQSVKEKTRAMTIAHARLVVYQKLLNFEAAKEHKKILSNYAVKTGMARVWRYFLNNPVKYFYSLQSGLKKVWTDKNILLGDKILALFLPFFILQKAVFRKKP